MFHSYCSGPQVTRRHVVGGCEVRTVLPDPGAQLGHLRLEHADPVPGVGQDVRKDLDRTSGGGECIGEVLAGDS